MYPSVTLFSEIMKGGWSNCTIIIIPSFTISFHCRNERLSQQSVNMLESPNFDTPRPTKSIEITKSRRISFTTLQSEMRTPSRRINPTQVTGCHHNKVFLEAEEKESNKSKDDEQALEQEKQLLRFDKQALEQESF